MQNKTKQESIIYNQEKNKYTKTDPKLTQMLELADKFNKTYYFILCVQRVRGKIIHVKKRYERY